jgi:hypothetical protein
MTISLHTQTCAPNTAAATSVSPLDPSGSSKTKFSKTRTDIYQTVTDNIITALEAGVKPWCVRGSVWRVCLGCLPITPPARLIAG